MLREKEKKASKNSLISLGELFVKAKIEHIDSEILVGALLEISDNLKNEKKLITWREKAQEYEKSLKNLTTRKNGNAITVSFKNPPVFEVREKLKEMNFKWNAFRGEYYGFGEKGALENLLENHECKIQMIDE